MVQSPCTQSFKLLRFLSKTQIHIITCKWNKIKKKGDKGKWEKNKNKKRQNGKNGRFVFKN
jgi:hypothetical protein